MPAISASLTLHSHGNSVSQPHISMCEQNGKRCVWSKKRREQKWMEPGNWATASVTMAKRLQQTSFARHCVVMIYLVIYTFTLNNWRLFLIMILSNTNENQSVLNEKVVSFTHYPKKKIINSKQTHIWHTKTIMSNVRWNIEMHMKRKTVLSLILLWYF